MPFETRFSQLETGRIRVSIRLFLLRELAFRCCADSGASRDACSVRRSLYTTAPGLTIFWAAGQPCKVS